MKLILKGIIRFILWPLHRGKFIILLSFSLNTYGQKLFINKSLTEAQDYWMEMRQPRCVKTEKIDQATTNLYVLCGEVGTPEFSAYFDEAGICYQQVNTTSNENLGKYMSTWRQKGYQYDPTHKVWTKGKIEIEVEPVGQYMSQITFLLEK